MSDLDILFHSVIKQSDDNIFDVDNIFSMDKNILVLSKEKELHGREHFLRSFDHKNIFFIDTIKNLDDCDIVISLGFGSLVKYLNVVNLLYDKKFVFLEAGFLRSIVMDKTDSIFDRATCFFVDTIGHHYDCNVPSRIEKILDDKKFNINKNQEQRAKKIIELLIRNKLTKYNDQPIIKNFNVGSVDRPKILVVEQARKDWAIIRGNGNDHTFLNILEKAIKDNPEYDILVKLHPDTLNGKRGGMDKSYFGKLENNKNLYVIKEKINPYSLLEKCEKIYTFSSMLGFEALLLGKETHVFGTPCYAGWGLTVDYQIFHRRTVKRNLLELVYALYVIYTRYIDNDGNVIQAEDAIFDLLEKRKLFNQ